MHYTYKISEKVLSFWYKIDSCSYTHASSGSWIRSAMKFLLEHVLY